MNLKHSAHLQGVHLMPTGGSGKECFRFRPYRSGRAPCWFTPSRPLAPGQGVGLCARVSAHDQRGDLERQLAWLGQWAAAARLAVARNEAEVASGLSRQRPKLRRLLADPEVTTVVVGHRDRLAHMNVDLIQAALVADGRRLVVLDVGEVTNDLVCDIVEVLTSFCALLYGRCWARYRALRRCGASRPAAPPVVG
jgi:putative resolvase